jgi:hypothetical protein
MEEEKDPSPEYISKFNDGYNFGKLDPEIGVLIAGIKTNSPKANAFKAGLETSMDEQEKTLMPSNFRSPADRAKDQSSPERDVQKDRGIEPER